MRLAAMVRNAVRCGGDGMAGNIQEWQRIYQQHNRGYDFPPYRTRQASDG